MLSKLEKKFKLIQGDEEVAYLRYAESKVNYNNVLITKNMKLLELHNESEKLFENKITYKQYMESKKNLLEAEKNQIKSLKTLNCHTKKYLSSNNKSRQLKLKINALLQENYFKLKEREEKKEQKIIKKQKTKDPQYYSEEILKKISKLPEVIVNIISEYLPYNVRIALIEDKYKATISSFHNNRIELLNYPYKYFMFVCFLESIGTSSEFLYLLTRQEAREQILSLTGYRYKLQYVYCGDTCNSKILKNKILWATEMAKNSNSKFAYKIMKMIIILGESNRFNPIITSTARKYLTVEDLPEEYR
jgi:hypothetical protein